MLPVQVPIDEGWAVLSSRGEASLQPQFLLHRGFILVMVGKDWLSQV